MAASWRSTTGNSLPSQPTSRTPCNPSRAKEIALFVHDASGKYARPGAVLDDPRDGRAYRGATERPEQRNWVGVVGDMMLSWRPATSIADVQVLPSVRKKTLEAPGGYGRRPTQGITGPAACGGPRRGQNRLADSRKAGERKRHGEPGRGMG